MDRDVILAYLFNCGAIRERGEYDINNNPKIKIKSLKKIDNGYKVCGNLSIELGEFCKEEDLFQVTFSYFDSGIVITTEMQSINSFIPFNDFSSNYIIKGDIFRQKDTFKLITNNGKISISHNNNDRECDNIDYDNCNALEKFIIRDLNTRYNYPKKCSKRRSRRLKYSR